MYLLLLSIIYISFISLGLPDSLLGSAWPVIRIQFNAGVDFAGVISMIIAGSTIISSLLSDRLTWKFGTGLVTAASVAMTAAALYGFSISSSLALICIWSIPYGLGAGAIDAALNNYVALHYSSRHMSWLHCFWGVGASISPYIMGHFLLRSSDWQSGYKAVSLIQLILTSFLLISLPIWKKRAESFSEDEGKKPPIGLKKAISIKGVSYIMIAFLCYCGAETTCGLWASSYLVEIRMVTPEVAARFASLFYLGITAGRFLNGFIADLLGDKTMIRTGIAIMILGTIMIFLLLKSTFPSLVGLLIFGVGCAPVYPCIIHSTPYNFGRENSQAIIGIQMASAYAGSTFMPPIFGLIGRHISMNFYPVYIAMFAVILLVMTEKLNCAKSGNNCEKNGY